MKKILYSLLTLAAALTVASCQQELVGGSAYDDGSTVDATFAVNLGVQTKAFADGGTVDQLYAGIYEIGTSDSYTWVADNADAPIAISAGAATVTFNGKIKLGKSYKVVFWAQKEGAPYAINWAKNATTGPAVTATATGAANNESRDAFFGMYETGAVTGSIDLTGSPVTLKRPFAQVNVLVPTANFADATAAVSSSMTVFQAPTVLNLATKATSVPADWTFNSAAINETAFGSYASTHKYVAMNYVLVDQTAADARYDVTFSVTAGTQTATDKQVKNAPLKVNGRTNIVGNVFDENFNITVPIVIDPSADTDQVLTTVTVAVGQTAAEAVELTYNPTTPATTSIEVAVSHPVTEDADKPTITVEPATVATAAWNLTTGKLDVTPLVANGNAVITLVFPAVTKTDYSAATVQVYVKVGNGQNTPVADVKTLKSITVTAPTKVEYTEGETLDLTGMVVKATYSHSNGDDDSEETLTEGFTTTPAAGATLATTNDKVTVSYTEGEVTKTAEFTITVNAAPTETYIELTSENIAAATGEAAYGAEKTVTVGSYTWMDTGYRNSQDNNVFVQLRTSSDPKGYIQIPIVPGTIDKVVVTTEAEANIGFYADKNGDVVTSASATTESTLTLAAGTYRNGFIKSTDGGAKVSNIKVYYTADNATLSSVAITTPASITEYALNETVSFDGELTATFSNNSTANVTYYATASGNTATAGSSIVTVSYGGKSDTYSISVSGESVAYHLDGTVTDSENGYASDNETTQDNVDWIVTGNISINPWRIGGKSLNAVDRYLYSKTAIAEDVSKVVVEHGTASGITVNSMTLYVCSTAAGAAAATPTNVVSTLTGTFVESGEVEFDRPAGVSWANCYYRIVYNVTVTVNSNKFMQFIGAKFYSN